MNMSQLMLKSLAGRSLTGVARALNRLALRLPEAIRTMSQCAKSSSGSRKAIDMKTINPNIVKLQYAVRGPLVIRATEIEKELKEGAQKPFKRVIRANIGDAHAMGQKPITYTRQLLACLTFPELIKKYKFPEDVKKKACEILCACGGQSIGAYSASYGIEMIRRHVSEYIAARDGHPSNWENVCLSSGASAAIKNVLQLLVNCVNGKPTGVMIPIPQYPLYSASIAEFGLGQVGYYLNEDTNWGLDIEELERALAEGSQNNAVRAIVVINPGNPTGQVLTRKNIEAIIKFAHKHRLLIFADEVYQSNVYAAGSKFFSFKKVLMELGDEYASNLEVASFNSCSKGFMGECGMRGGWMELVNFDKEVQVNLYKAISANLCPSVLGQSVVDVVACPPKEGEPSYEQFKKESSNVLAVLAERASLVVESFNSMKGFKCNIVQGAMYAFPQIQLPEKVIQAAKKANKPPDVYYAFALLEQTGICIIPGSGFGQKPGTYHFRTTILPQTELLKQMLVTFKEFHTKFT